MKRFFLLFIIFGAPFVVHAQDTAYVYDLVRKLSAENLHGRGYVNDGGKKAALLVRDEYKKWGLQSFSGDYLQRFEIPMNTLTKKLTVRFDEKELLPGSEYLITASSPSSKGSYELVWDTSFGYNNWGDTLSETIIQSLQDKVVLTNKPHHYFIKGENPFSSSGIISISDENLSWHVSDGGQVNDYFILIVKESSFPKDAKTVYISAKTKFMKKYPVDNVIAYVPGKEYPDSFLVFTAHYDHLGQMGDQTFFPGANDNASGTAMLLDLARHYSQPENQHDYSLLFIAFGAEEAGLCGSFFFAQNPLVELNQFAFLINLDMVGSGSDGIKVVNGGIFEKAFGRMQAINSKEKLLEKVSKRGAAANSDHFPFYEKGVPCFFIYSLGAESLEYHTINDTPKNAPFTAYPELFKLLELFVKTF